jgi:predicted lipoprotein with Yx(FWY)xxD motif
MEGPTTMRTRIGAIGAALFVFTLAACSGGSNGADGYGGNGAAPAAGGEQAGQQPGAAPADANKLVVKATRTGLGTILTDAHGRTLYAFTKDKDGASSCAGPCIATWPALISASAPEAGEGVTSALLGTTDRAEGTVQATYQEWPLYYYVGDIQAGDTTGQGLNGVWFVVNAADGTLVKA